MDYLQIQEYEKFKIYTLCTFFLCTKENCRKMTIQRLLITIIKSIKKLIKKIKNYLKIIIQTDEKLLLKFWLAHFP